MRSYRTWGRSRAFRLPPAFYTNNEVVHVILTTACGAAVFEERGLGDAVFGAVESHPATWTACLMPNHLHWLLRIEDSLPKQIQGFKSYSTRLAWQSGFTGKLWQRSFYDHLVRTPEALRSVVQYIVDNPLRAGLVERSKDWPFVVNRLEI